MMNELTEFQKTIAKIEEKYEKNIESCPFSIMAVDCTDLKQTTFNSKTFYGKQITKQDIKVGGQSIRANYYVFLDPKHIVGNSGNDIYRCSTVDEVYQVLECLLIHSDLFIDYENPDDVLSQPDTMSLSDLKDFFYPGMEKIGIDKVIT